MDFGVDNSKAPFPYIKSGEAPPFFDGQKGGKMTNKREIECLKILKIFNRERKMSKNAKAKPLQGSKPDHSEKLLELESAWKALLENGVSGLFNPDGLKDLAQVFDNQPEIVESLLKKALIQADPQSAQLLAAFQDQVLTKGAHKQIKRALYLLEQRGIALPGGAEQEKPAGAGVLRAMTPPTVYGYLSDYDEGGNRMAAMLLPKGLNEKVFLFALINGLGEMENLTVLEVNKKEAKRILEDLREQSGQAFWEAAPEHTAFLIKEAHDRGSNLDQSGEGNWSAIINLLSALGVVGQAPVIRSLLQSEVVEDLDMPGLLSLSESTRFFVKPELFEPFRQSIQTVLEGVLIVSPEQKKAQIENIIQKAVEEIFQGVLRERLIRFFEEAAYLHFIKNQQDNSRLLLQAAHSLDSAEKLGENPYLLWLVGSVLSPRQDSSSETAPREETTPGGIIIPPWVNREGVDR